MAYVIDSNGRFCGVNNFPGAAPADQLESQLDLLVAAATLPTLTGTNLTKTMKTTKMVKVRCKA